MTLTKEAMIKKIKEDVKLQPDKKHVLVIGSASETPTVYEDYSDANVVRAKHPDTAQAMIESGVFNLILLGREYRWHDFQGNGNTDFYTQEQLDKMQSTIEELSIPLIKIFAE